MVGVEDLWRNAHTILVIALLLVEGEVLVDVLHVGIGLVACVVRLRLFFRLWRITLGVVIQFIAVQYAAALVVVVRAAEAVVVIASRVVTPGFDDAVVGDDATVYHLVEPLLVGAILALLVVVESVEADILQPSRARGGGEGIGLGGLHGYLSPLGGGIVARAIDGHAALVEFLTVAQDVLRDLAQVEVEVTAIV